MSYRSASSYTLFNRRFILPCKNDILLARTKDIYCCSGNEVGRKREKKLIPIIFVISLLHILYYCNTLRYIVTYRKTYTPRVLINIVIIYYIRCSHNKSSTKRSQGSRNGIRFPFYSGILATASAYAHIPIHICFAQRIV